MKHSFLNKQIFACESVSEGHPDKFCDQIVDSILDCCVKIDRNARVGCEALAINNNIFITGEFNMKTRISDQQIRQCVQNVMKIIDYTDDPNISIKKTNIKIFLQQQSAELSAASKNNLKKLLLPNDQGITIGYACDYYQDKTDDYMPIQFTLSNYLVKRANNLRKAGKFTDALPDMKSQINYHYKGSKKHIVIDSVLLSVQHKKSYAKQKFHDFIKNDIIHYALNKYKLTFDKNLTLFINPHGDFFNGGCYADTGLSGRKIVVDSYGSTVPNGGGSLCGKDMSKIDRLGNYYARYIAKNVVAAKLCNEIKVEISFIISREEVAGLNIDTFDSFNKKVVKNDQHILGIIKQVFDLSPEMMYKILQIGNHHKFVKIAKYGHYGNNAKNYPWERLDKVIEIKNLVTPIKD